MNCEDIPPLDFSKLECGEINEEAINALQKEIMRRVCLEVKKDWEAGRTMFVYNYEKHQYELTLKQ